MYMILCRFTSILTVAAQSAATCWKSRLRSSQSE